MIKDGKVWELTDELNKVDVESSHGATTSQMKWHLKPTTEQNPKNIILRCCANDINDDSETQMIAEKIIKLAKSITKSCNSNVTASRIFPDMIS